jgi:hypothetical protein
MRSKLAIIYINVLIITAVYSQHESMRRKLHRNSTRDDDESLRRFKSSNKTQMSYFKFKGEIDTFEQDKFLAELEDDLKKRISDDGIEYIDLTLENFQQVVKSVYNS